MLMMVIRKRVGTAMMILRKNVFVINNANVFNMFQRVDGCHMLPQNMMRFMSMHCSQFSPRERAKPQIVFFLHDV